MSAKPGRVVRSINDANARHCVDLFVRPDGSYGFEHYRRDAEDPAGGWFPIGGYAQRVYSDEAAALAAAAAAVIWLKHRAFNLNHPLPRT